MGKINKAFKTDDALIAAILKKDKTAFSYLFDKYAQAIFGIIYGITRDQSISEEILQRSFCVFWNLAGSYQPSKQRLFTWMLRIAGGLARESLILNENKIQGRNIYVHDSKDLINLGLNSSGILDRVFEGFGNPGNRQVGSKT